MTTIPMIFTKHGTILDLKKRIELHSSHKKLDQLQAMKSSTTRITP